MLCLQISIILVCLGTIADTTEGQSICTKDRKRLLSRCVQELNVPSGNYRPWLRIFNGINLPPEIVEPACITLLSSSNDTVVVLSLIHI